MSFGDDPNTVDFEDCTCIAETPKALKVVINSKAEWIPKSQIDEDSEIWHDGQSGTLIITEWLAIKKGLE